MFSHLERMAEEVGREFNMLRFIVDSLPVGIFHTDENGNVLWVNKKWCRLSGLTIEETKECWRSAINEKDREQVIKKWAHCVETGKDYRSAYCIVNVNTGKQTRCISQAVKIDNFWIGTITPTGCSPNFCNFGD